MTTLWDDITKKLLWAVIVLVATSSLMAFTNTNTLKAVVVDNKTQTKALGDIAMSLELLKKDLKYTERDLHKHIDSHE